ncbi:MAG TPA: Gfo/Idh/MocA family oxidoreductase [Solirubrobacteraceae bacterium]|jgi:predicted dehydrogenase|nr:Gfo/Idh/MocA family oxidoreductase [Solirubrobacteraceae bacterium]
MTAPRVGIVGLGVISRYYLDALAASPELQLTAACDRRPERLERLPAGVVTTHDVGELVARDDVDALLVTLPNDLHAPVCADALRAGKHVCCEKPLATSAADAERLVALASEHDRVLMTAFHRRYNAHLVGLRDRLRGARIVRAHATYHEDIREHVGDDAWYLDAARCGGGCIADNGPNAFDALRSVLGPLEVRCAQIERDGAHVDRRARIELTGGGGIEAVVELRWDYPDGEHKTVAFELEGGERVAVDFLSGYPGFKSSLEHEYRGVLADFAARVRGDAATETGSEMTRLVERTYRLETASRT